jgi:hypothetical protein
LSFPAGLPLFPGSKGISGIASVLHFQLSARIPARSSSQNGVLSSRTKGEHQGTAAVASLIVKPCAIMTASVQQKLEQLEARMDEIADRVARDRTNAARERTSTHEAQRPSY